MARTLVARHPATQTTGEATAMTTRDAVATTTTSACSDPVSASMNRKNEETIVDREET
jgi:hypothetical protein